jgi:hypothetical protein
MIYNAQISNQNRESVINYILSKKQNGKFTVVDVGGSINGWSIPYVDAIVDFNPLPELNDNNKSIKYFSCDITNPYNYDEINKYILENGKFDFCICTHTLEDIMNPGFVLTKIAEMSKEGYIAFPSKYRELSYCEGNWRGYIHHRWIFTIKNNVLIGFPKIGYLESTNLFNSIMDLSENKSDLSFFWKEKIEFKYINNNYLGPNKQSVLGYYNNLCDPSYF